MYSPKYFVNDCHDATMTSQQQDFNQLQCQNHKLRYYHTFLLFTQHYFIIILSETNTKTTCVLNTLNRIQNNGAKKKIQHSHVVRFAYGDWLGDRLPLDPWTVVSWIMAFDPITIGSWSSNDFDLFLVKFSVFIKN